MQLRTYQQDAIRSIYERWRDHRKLLLVLPTGTGKTIVFANVAATEDASGKRTLILAHRDELIRQAADKLRLATGLACATEKAEETAVESLYRITVGSVQTLTRQARLDRYRPDDYDTIIVDEAHHALSDSYQRVLDYFGEARVLGVTATPDRGDKRNLGQYFDDCAYEYHLPKAISDGYLCPISAQTIPLEIDLAGVRTTAGDYNDADLGTALDPYLERIADEMAATVPDRKTLVFLPLIATSKRMTELLRDRGFAAAHIDGTSRDRREILADFTAGRHTVLCNSMLLTEGYDEPSLDCVVCLRPTKVRSLYAQIIGRGTRIHPGKRDLLILDFLWHTDKHDLCHPAHLVAGSAEIAAKMTAATETAGGPVDLGELEEQAERDAALEREEALRKSLAANRRKKARLLDPVQFSLSIAADDLMGYEPVFPWEYQPASEKQIEALERFGLDGKVVPCRGYASKLLDRVFARRKMNLASVRQAALLKRYGYRDSELMTFEEASATIETLAANQWRRPGGGR